MKNSILQGTLGKLAIAAMIATVASGMVVAERGPQKVGELEPIAIATPNPYPVSFGMDARTWTVHYPDATYIRLHFTDFNLAAGDFVEIHDLDGRHARTYTGKGLHGAGDFWAHTIPGDTAIIRMQATVGGDSGFGVDGYGRGFAPIFAGGVTDPGVGDPAPESVCGSQDWQNVECYNGSAEYDRAQAAVKLQIGCCSACTGWKASDSGQFMTNNHCVASTSEAMATELLFDYQTPGCTSGSASPSGSVFGDVVQATDYTLDYTLMTTLGDSSSIPCLTLDPNQAANGTRMYIAHHPNAGPKKLSIDSDWDNGPCVVFDNAHNGRGTNTDIAYYCDTIGGSSGSPVLDSATHQVIALHHFGGCLNSGGRSDLIYNQIQNDLDVCTGGGSSCNNNGVIDGDEKCDGSDLGGATCQSQGFDGGILACNNCSYDTSGCTTDPGVCTLGQKGDSCVNDSNCCSNKCRGKRGRKTCK